MGRKFPSDMAEKRAAKRSAEQRWRDDMYDVVEVEWRMANETGERKELDEFLDELGLGGSVT